jgi:hypothetical protein
MIDDGMASCKTTGLIVDFRLPIANLRKLGLLEVRRDRQSAIGNRQSKIGNDYV